MAGLIARIQIPAALAGSGSGAARRDRGLHRSQAVGGVGRDLSGHAVLLSGLGVRRGVDAAVGHRGLGRLRHQRAVPARRARQGGCQAQFVARGEYKSAANLFTQDSYTDAHREADSRLVESLHSQVLAGGGRVPRHRRRGDGRAGRPGAAAAGRRGDRGARGPHRLPRRGVRPDRRTRRCAGNFTWRRRPTARTRRRGCTCRATPRRPPAVPIGARAARPSPPSPSSPWPARSSAAVAAGSCRRSGHSSAGGDTIAAALREAVADDESPRSCCGSTAPAGR